MGGGGTLPSNPVHNHTGKNDGTDTTTWSYVYFGSYPQTEVTGSDLTAEIQNASYDSNGDAEVSGVKYRRISKSDTNHDGLFGNSTYRYFKWERIKWRVMQNNGSTLFVVADKGLDCKCYNDVDQSITWENCTLRNWLNNSFYNTAFSSAEQGAIVRQTVTNDNNPWYGTVGGNDTQDAVYLLSIAEAKNASYGFCQDDTVASNSRRMKPSDYAHARGAWQDNNAAYEGNCWWWLRSPGTYTNSAATVNNRTYLIRNSTFVFSISGAACPALRINLSSDLWSMADGEGSGSGGENNGAAGEGCSITAGKKSLTIRWQRNPSAAGYQIQYSTSKKFTKKATKTKTIKKNSITSLTVKKLKSKKTYYVRIRTYKKAKGKMRYSAWMKTETAKTK